MSTKSAEKAENTEAQQAMPILYSGLTPLRSDVHGALKIKQSPGYGFASKINAVPIVVSELWEASHHFPIVFARDNPGVIMAILSNRQDHNYFVGEDGSWKEGVYVPAYIRRYPFYIVQSDDPERVILCIDETAEHLSKDGDVALFENGEQTEQLKTALKFSQTLQAQIKVTADFVKALDEKELINDSEAVFRQDGVRTGAVKGFKMIDRKKLNDLNGGVIKSWLSKGYLDACLYHLASLKNFDRLNAMGAKK